MAASYKSTVSPPNQWQIEPSDRWLVDPKTGAPVGIANRRGTGEDGQFYPVEVTAAQIANPSAAMIADVKATYCLNEAPYSRYMSDGVSLVGLQNADQTVINSEMRYSPWTIDWVQGASVRGGGVRVIDWPV